MRYTLLYIMTIVVASVLTACDNQTVYYHYEHTLTDGWDRTDTLHYQIASLPASGDYKAEVGVRINRSYRFQNVGVIVDITSARTRQTWSDTVNCIVRDTDGDVEGQGFSQYTVLFPLKQLHLQQGDTLNVSIHHHMRREVLQGITDVGIKIKK